MGLIGLIISVLIIILGAGYYFFQSKETTISVSNETPVPQIEMNTDGLSKAQELIEEAKDIKETVEQKVEEQVKEAEKTKTPTPALSPAPVEEEKTASFKIINRLMDSGFAVPKKERNIDTIVLHSSYNALGGDPYSVSLLVKEYEEYGVSAHYLIDRQGGVYRLVEDKNISYHAGASKMPDGRQSVNDFSIGIELMNKKDTEYTNAQYTAVDELIAYLKDKHSIKYVVGHGDIAPSRKTDPWNFDWKKLK